MISYAIISKLELSPCSGSHAMEGVIIGKLAFVGVADTVLQLLLDVKV